MNVCKQKRRTLTCRRVQVTFTLDDPRYQPDSLENPGSPKIIPLHSVRVGQGTFFAYASPLSLPSPPSRSFS